MSTGFKGPWVDRRTPEQIARAIAREAPRNCGCPSWYMCCQSEDNPQGHHVGCKLWGTDQRDLEEQG